VYPRSGCERRRRRRVTDVQPLPETGVRLALYELGILLGSLHTMRTSSRGSAGGPSRDASSAQRRRTAWRRGEFSPLSLEGSHATMRR
jgi:hypothetical protein